MMTYHEKWKEAVHAAATEAAKHYKSDAAFGLAVGLSRHQIAAFLRSKHLDSTARDQLAKELEDAGYLRRDARAKEVPAPYGEPHDLAWRVGQNMITTGLWLQSDDLTRDEKIGIYSEWLKRANSHFERLCTAQEESGE